MELTHKEAVEYSLLKWFVIKHTGICDNDVPIVLNELKLFGGFSNYCALCEYYNETCSACILKIKWTISCINSGSLYEKWRLEQSKEKRMLIADRIYNDINEIYNDIKSLTIK